MQNAAVVASAKPDFGIVARSSAMMVNAVDMRGDAIVYGRCPPAATSAMAEMNERPNLVSFERVTNDRIWVSSAGMIHVNDNKVVVVNTANQSGRPEK